MRLAPFYSGSLALLFPALALAQGTAPRAEASPASTDAAAVSPSAPEPSSAPEPAAAPEPSAAPELTASGDAPSPAGATTTADAGSSSAAPAAPSGTAPATDTSKFSVAPVPKTEKPEPEKPTVAISAAPGYGVTFDTGEYFSLNIKGRIQVRYQILNSPGAPEPQQTVGVGALRLGFSGHVLTKKLNYLVQLAFAPREYRDGAISPVYDAFLDWKGHRDISVKVGQYFVPFDRLRTVREFALQMTERPRPVAELTLDRDLGVTLYSDKFLGEKSPFAYRIGAFSGGGINLTSGKTPGTLLVGRLELRPLGPIDDDVEGDVERHEEPGLAIGVAGAINLNSNRMKSTSGDIFVGGTTNQYHFATDLVFKWQGFALQGEYLLKQAEDEVIVSTAADGTEVNQPTRSGQGWVTQASYLFPVPFEVVGRLAGLYAFEGTDPKFTAELDKFGQEVGAGVNYYVNKHRFKIQADWIARMPHNFDMSVAENAVRAQVDMTF